MHDSTYLAVISSKRQYKFIMELKCSSSHNERNLPTYFQKIIFTMENF